MWLCRIWIGKKDNDKVSRGLTEAACSWMEFLLLISRQNGRGFTKVYAGVMQERNLLHVTQISPIYRNEGGAGFLTMFQTMPRIPTLKRQSTSATLSEPRIVAPLVLRISLLRFTT